MEKQSDLFALESLAVPSAPPARKFAFHIRSVRIVSEMVCEAPSELCDSVESAVEYMKGAFDEHPDQEALWVILLNRKNRPIGRQLITLGTATSSLSHPREVFRAAIVGSATGIICVHNHPSGD
ncbi:MAG: JAB domain-containing protein, partial [Rariglobus sp.]